MVNIDDDVVVTIVTLVLCCAMVLETQTHYADLTEDSNTRTLVCLIQLCMLLLCILPEHHG